MGLSSARQGLWGFQLCPGTARKSSAALQGMSICLLHLEEREGSLWGYFSHVWDRLLMGQLFEGQANQSHDLGSTERAKLGKLQIVAAETTGDTAVAFCWRPVLCPLGEAQRTLFGVSAFPSHFSDTQD